MLLNFYGCSRRNPWKNFGSDSGYGSSGNFQGNSEQKLDTYKNNLETYIGYWDCMVPTMEN